MRLSVTTNLILEMPRAAINTRGEINKRNRAASMRLGAATAMAVGTRIRRSGVIALTLIELHQSGASPRVRTRPQ